MRRAAFLFAALAALAGCSEEGAAGGAAAARSQDAAGQADDGIACALDGAKDFTRSCTRQIARSEEGEIWLIRHPDGGFRRFVIIDAGTRIATADGAEEVEAERKGANLEVRVGGQRYLFPAGDQPDASSR